MRVLRIGAPLTKSQFEFQKFGSYFGPVTEAPMNAGVQAMATLFGNRMRYLKALRIVAATERSIGRSASRMASCYSLLEMSESQLQKPVRTMFETSAVPKGESGPAALLPPKPGKRGPYNKREKSDIA
ncbi:hypothetical protein EN858_17405 [Mesorhizobium sp. M4B.F.Ca.ET.215.01.1.1]|uniref:hypothetical protein n=1 Tax=unclassified Mesorhizobium TaxID=325217 RepID=UPI000FCACA89|nr:MULTISPECIES: hypothetical protein [unclassified Mesorhizobium]RUW65533.1 hypothetical protein EOA31_33490 [Mesorhizobium sp. M4B.F.Ca.ET.049.02.1.2]RWX62361.1 hypothetical protein EN780_26880 [Mesorhizobium sp. M4B.F.Ca.ET.089.01.1.1]TGQ10192.1 hypothetical protein EN858_17405 [Mesorhizobium sp. M4B.F.Ca.ET.215.01.1.1]TGQ34029.1 hypothetical protein EN863_033575 [Mesorhizobium sp. M00.F.Ca.ET.220.01.1.1]TGR02731.1 hypothetical protein EN846_16855 [Mesorhizobium sp. M4B.F.Ca.ET.203.01.1.1]